MYKAKIGGAIIAWTYDNPPYLASGTRILQDMITAYRAGSKYVIVHACMYACRLYVA